MAGWALTGLLAQSGEAAAAGQTAEIILFWLLSAIAIVAAVGMVTLRNVVHGALLLVVNFFAIAGLFLVLESSFLAIVQIIVYAGAIMVLFLFVIMLLGVDRDDLLVERDRWSRAAAWGLATVFAGGIAFVFVGPYTTAGSVCGTGAATSANAVACEGLTAAIERAGSTVRLAAEPLFSRYLFAFEFVALVLVVATVGAILIGRERDEPHRPRGPDDVDLGPAGGTTRGDLSAPHRHGSDDIPGAG